MHVPEFETESQDHLTAEPADWASLADDQVMRPGNAQETD